MATTARVAPTAGTGPRTERTPEEALGPAAAGDLLPYLVKASVGTAVLLVGLTVLPWGFRKAGLFAAAPAPANAPSSEAAAPTALPAPAGTGAASAPAAARTDAASPAVTGGASPGDPRRPEVLERLGIGQEKTAPPNVNPLEGRTDDLFRDP